MFDYETIALHWVNRLGFLVRKELGQRFLAEGFRISAEEWAVLLLLWKHTERTPGMIAAATFRDRTTVTRLIDGMVKKGLVERDIDPNDRRKSIVRASEHGIGLKEQLVPIAQRLIAQTARDIEPGDLETTVRTLKAMTGNLLPAGNPLPETPSQTGQQLDKE